MALCKLPVLEKLCCLGKSVYTTVNSCAGGGRSFFSNTVMEFWCNLRVVPMFIDESKIYVCSGRGGDGVIQFRREKFVPTGGPSGGDGGRGGDIIFRVNPKLNTLLSFRRRHKIFAENGKRGAKSNQTGKSGQHMYLDVPPGTLIYNDDTGALLGDLTAPDQTLVV